MGYFSDLQTGRYKGSRGRVASSSSGVVNGGGSNFKIEGLNELIASIQKIPDDRIKRREILKIERRQVKPILDAVKANTPVANKAIKVRGIVYNPENLKRSMGIKVSPLKNYVNVLIGPRMGLKYKYDGWYVHFLQYGTSQIKPNDFILKAAEPLLPRVYDSCSKELAKYIEQQAKKAIE